MRRQAGGVRWAIRATAIAAVLTAGALGAPLTPAAPGVRVGQPAPEITGSSWLNSDPLSIAGLRGRVVFVEFWTFGCVNCQNVLPQLRAWHDRYSPAGLTIVGVHSPEFLWEKPRDRVAAAVRELDIRYPVVQDNDHAIWTRFNTWAWPTAVLVDRRGVIRYTHIGEGAYAETEDMIRQLLDERG
jgi:thiol-disulfide isomerase/thioredoxin